MRTEGIREHDAPRASVIFRPGVVRNRLRKARKGIPLDIFLKAEVISSSGKTGPIREALDRRGYEPVVKHFQFEREVDYMGRARKVKVDFLAAPVPAELSANVRADSVRVRPRDGKGLHAHLTPEALTVEEFTIAIDIGGDDERLTVYLPHPFSYLLLKLHAADTRGFVPRVTST